MKAPTPTLLRGDARNLPLADNSVDLIVTSPPFFGLRDYRDGDGSLAGQVGAEPTPADFVDVLVACTREWLRVLKPAGSLFVNLGDGYASRSEGFQRGARDGVRQPWVRPVSGVTPKSLFGIPWRYAIRCTDDLGLVLRQELIWSKPNGLPESVSDRARRSHEQWFHFTMQRYYHADIDAIREPHSPGTAARAAAGFKSKRINGAANAGQMRNDLAAGYVPNALGKLPGSVWEIAARPLHVPAELGVDHFAAFPMEWPRRLIKGWCPPDGVVLDPFGGTGTTALVATMLGRHGISIDLSADYCRLARWRAGDPKERARAAGLDSEQVARVSPSLPGQLDMFGEVAS